MRFVAVFFLPFFSFFLLSSLLPNLFRLFFYFCIYEFLMRTMWVVKGALIIIFHKKCLLNDFLSDIMWKDTDVHRELKLMIMMHDNCLRACSQRCHDKNSKSFRVVRKRKLKLMKWNKFWFLTKRRSRYLEGNILKIPRVYVTKFMSLSLTSAESTHNFAWYFFKRQSQDVLWNLFSLKISKKS